MAEGLALPPSTGAQRLASRRRHPDAARDDTYRHRASKIACGAYAPTQARKVTRSIHESPLRKSASDIAKIRRLHHVSTERNKAELLLHTSNERQAGTTAPSRSLLRCPRRGLRLLVAGCQRLGMM